MLKAIKGGSGDFFAEVTDREGKVLVSVRTGSDESSALDFFSQLSASLSEGFRGEIIREGF
jgi:hypothetical protein